MKILHVDETFHPNFGYQCNPLAKFQQKAGHEVFIIAPEAKYIYHVYHDFNEYGETLDEDDLRYETETGVSIIRVHARGKILNRLDYKMGELFQAIDNIRPDVIMVHCVETLTAMRLMRRLRRRYPMVFDSHMLKMASSNKFAKVYEMGYRIFYTSIIKHEGYMVIKTQNDNYVTDQLGVPPEQTKYISFGTDTKLFAPNNEIKKEFIKQHGLSEDSLIITSPGKLNKAKGGLLLAEAVKKKFNTKRPVVIVIVADFSKPYELQVKEMLMHSENRVFFYPVQKYQELPRFYQIADIAVFPRQCSMSFYDAQSCGNVVVSESNNVNEDRNSHENGLCFVSGDSDDLRKKIELLANLDITKFERMKNNSIKFIQDNYSYEKIAELYTNELVLAKQKFDCKYKK